MSAVGHPHDAVAIGSALPQAAAARTLTGLIPHLRPALQRRTRILLEALGPGGVAVVADLHAALFPESSLASANAALNRLLAEINRAAAGAGVDLTILISGDKKAGAARRHVWCEASGPERVPPIPAPTEPVRDAVAVKIDPASLFPGKGTVVPSATAWLRGWAMDADGPSIVALLGEDAPAFTRALAHELDKDGRGDARRPSPLLLNLRRVRLIRPQLPTLSEILDDCAEQSWAGSTATGADLQRWMANLNLVVIVDGLDDLLAAIDPHERRTFVWTLMKMHRDAAARPGAPSLRLLLPCRPAVAEAEGPAPSNPLPPYLAHGWDWLPHGAFAALRLAPPRPKDAHDDRTGLR